MAELVARPPTDPKVRGLNNGASKRQLKLQTRISIDKPLSWTI